MIMTLLSLLFNVVSSELQDSIIFSLIIILQGVGWLFLITVLACVFIQFVDMRALSVLNILILFTRLSFFLFLLTTVLITLLLLISDQAVLPINIANESAIYYLFYFRT